jgi:hypothetical protein
VRIGTHLRPDPSLSIIISKIRQRKASESLDEELEAVSILLKLASSRSSATISLLLGVESTAGKITVPSFLTK